LAWHAVGVMTETITDKQDAPSLETHLTAPVALTPTWASLREIPAVVRFPPHLRKTVSVALVVGIVLFSINQLDIVLSGRATPFVWLKVGLTFFVPFCVSNYGILVASRRKRGGRRE
jgi:hypothetical protein